MQGHQRQEHQDDDDDAKDGGRGHFLRGIQDQTQAGAATGAGLSQAVKHVLHHHHRGVHHQANGNGQPPQGHQVGRDAIAVHQNEGGQRRNHQGGHHNQAGAHIAQEDKQHDDHQENALDQHFAHGPQRRVDQLGAVVVRHDLQAAGQHALGVDFVHPLFDARHHFLGIATAHHQHDARDRLGVAALDDGALAHLMAQGDVGQILDIHRRAVLLAHHDVANVFQAADQAHAANQVLLGALGQDATAGIGIVLRNGLIHLLDGHVVVGQTVGLDQGLVLPHIAALRIDFGHARNRAQQGSHHPVLNDAPLGQLGRRQRALAVLGMVQRVLVDLAQASGHRTQHRRDALRHARRHLDQALGDQLPGKKHIGLVGEHQGDDGQAAFVQGAHFHQARQTGECDLQGHGDEALDFFGRASGGFGRNLHLDVGDVRERIDRQAGRLTQAKGAQHQRQGSHHQALRECSANQCSQHGLTPTRRACARCSNGRRPPPPLARPRSSLAEPRAGRASCCPG